MQLKASAVHCEIKRNSRVETATGQIVSKIHFLIKNIKVNN